MSKLSRLVLLTMLATLILFALAACGGSASGSQSNGSQQISTKMSEMKFDPNTWTIRAGEPATISAQNVGTVVHDWSIRGANTDVSLVVQPGQSGSKTFTIDRPGTYEVYCSQPGHEATGMKGTLVVQ